MSTSTFSSSPAQSEHVVTVPAAGEEKQSSFGGFVVRLLFLVVACLLGFYVYKGYFEAPSSLATPSDEMIDISIHVNDKEGNGEDVHLTSPVPTSLPELRQFISNLYTQVQQQLEGGAARSQPPVVEVAMVETQPATRNPFVRFVRGFRAAVKAHPLRAVLVVALITAVVTVSLLAYFQPQLFGPMVPAIQHFFTSTLPDFLQYDVPLFFTVTLPHFFTVTVPHFFTVTVPHFFTVDVPYFVTVTLPHFITVTVPEWLRGPQPGSSAATA